MDSLRTEKKYPVAKAKLKKQLRSPQQFQLRKNKNKSVARTKVHEPWEHECEM